LVFDFGFDGSFVWELLVEDVCRGDLLCYDCFDGCIVVMDFFGAVVDVEDHVRGD